MVTWHCFADHTFRERLEYHQVCECVCSVVQKGEGFWGRGVASGSMIQSQALFGERCRHLVGEGGELRRVGHVDAARGGDGA